MKLGFQPVNINVQAYGNAVHVPGDSPWTVRATFALLFPKLTPAQEKMMMEQKLKQLDQTRWRRIKGESVVQKRTSDCRGEGSQRNGPETGC